MAANLYKKVNFVSLPTLISQKSTLRQRAESIANIRETCKVNQSAAVAMLRYFSWNADALLVSWRRNAYKTKKAAGVTTSISSGGSVSSKSTRPQYNLTVKASLDSNLETWKPVSSKSAVFKPFHCRFCGNNVPQKGFSFGLACGHKCCTVCFQNWVVAEFSKGKICLKSTCPFYECNCTLTAKSFHTFLRAEDAKQYSQWGMEQFWDESSILTKCPHENCDRVAVMGKRPNSENTNLANEKGVQKGANNEEVTLTPQVVYCCKDPWCFYCKGDVHVPASCIMMKKWAKLEGELGDQQFSDFYIAANTRECPNCLVRIEKDNGCKHMRCTACTHEFCWTCMTKWEPHMECTRPEDNMMSEDDKQAFTGHYRQYLEQKQALEANKKMLAKSRWEAYSKRKDIQAVNLALETLVFARATLLNVIICSFYDIKFINRKTADRVRHGHVRRRGSGQPSDLELRHLHFKANQDSCMDLVDRLDMEATAQFERIQNMSTLDMVAKSVRAFRASAHTRALRTTMEVTKMSIAEIMRTGLALSNPIFKRPAESVVRRKIESKGGQTNSDSRRKSISPNYRASPKPTGRRKSTSSIAGSEQDRLMRKATKVNRRGNTIKVYSKTPDGSISTRRLININCNPAKKLPRLKTHKSSAERGRQSPVAGSRTPPRRGSPVPGDRERARKRSPMSRSPMTAKRFLNLPSSQASALSTTPKRKTSF